MKHLFYCSLLTLAMASVCSLAYAGDTSNAHVWDQIVVGSVSESERLACEDFTRYVAQVTGNVPRVIHANEWKKHPSPAIVLGTPAGNQILQDIIDSDKLDDQGFCLCNSSYQGEPIIAASGKTPEGSVNAVYGLLREVGFGFYMGSETAPESLPTKLATDTIISNPVFKIRGVLPWYNFFNSPTTWDPIDHRAFADQLIRMGGNFIGFHTYDYEPFAAYKEDDHFVWGERLLNTSSPTWGTHPLSTDEFGFGTDRLYPCPYFGATTTRIADRDVAIEAEQDVMRDALDYAKKRGVHPCIGFEMWGDPLNPKDRDAFMKRFNHMLDKYPSVDYIWLWQAETQGVQGYTDNYNLHIIPYKLEKGSHINIYGAAWRETFHRIVCESKGSPPFFQDNGAGETARANEGARLTLFASLALNILHQREHSPKLIMSGWGGETRLLSAEYYDGLDKLLPKDVVFSSLDFITPLPKVDSIYHQLPPERERWPIVWLENDGDQWHPQPYVHILEQTVRDASNGGCQGLLGIHWRTRDIEENFAYTVEYAWNPKLTAETFFKDLAKKLYNKEIADEMASIHSELDKMGYRWVGGAGQNECAPFTWGPGSDDKATQLQAIKARIESILPDASRGRERLDWLLNNINWVLAYQKAEKAAVRANDLLLQSERLGEPESIELARKALEILHEGDLATAMRTYAYRITTRGEYGVLATINTKAFIEWKSLVDKAMRIAKIETIPAETEWNPQPRIIMPRFIGSIREGESLELQPISIGGSHFWLHYRTIGENIWKSEPITSYKKWVGQITISGSDIKKPGIEIGFSFSSDPSQPMNFGPIFISVLSTTRVNRSPIPKGNHPMEGKIDPYFRKNPAVPVEMAWNSIEAIDFYRIFRNNVMLAETPYPIFPDRPAHPTGTYRVEAIYANKTVASSSEVPYKANPLDADENIEVRTSISPIGVILRWPACKKPSIVSYKISRVLLDEPAAQQTECAEIPASRSVQNVFCDKPPSSGKWRYTIIPVSISGSTGKPIITDLKFAGTVDSEPILSLSLDRIPDECIINGDVTFGKEGATFCGGYLRLPHKSYMNIVKGTTISFEFRADSTQMMPVIMSHGLWLVDGWFVQILGGGLIIRTPKGDVTGPPIIPGTWYKVIFTYDGEVGWLSVNEQLYYNFMPNVSKSATTRDLIIGQYEHVAPEYAYRGTIKDINIFQIDDKK